ncbi:MAG: response regulator [Bacteroidetes bacterium]|jgi:two-component system chemotaxis response regulator CheY|nr:response regulator [Bacteroidota bacterium]
MEKITVIYLDDQREVLATIGKDLAFFENLLNLEECETVDEAEQLMENLYSKGHYVALVISDHIMPGKNGVEFLSEINRDDRFEKTKKVLLTGLATHEDTITAINNANIQRYIEKPWKSEELVQLTRELITSYILENGIDYEPFMEVLDQNTLYHYLHQQS